MTACDVLLASNQRALRPVKFSTTPARESSWEQTAGALYTFWKVAENPDSLWNPTVYQILFHRRFRRPAIQVGYR